MPIATASPSCKQRLQVSDQQAGKAVRCPKCQQIFQVPFAAAVVGASTSPTSSIRAREHPPLRLSDAGPRPGDDRFHPRPPRANTVLFWVIGLASGGLLVLVFMGVSIVVQWRLLAPPAENSTGVQQKVVVNKSAFNKNDAIGPIEKQPFPKTPGQAQPNLKTLSGGKDEVLPAQLKNGFFQVESNLGADDFADPVRNARRKMYEVELAANSQYIFECSSDDFPVCVTVDVFPMPGADLVFPVGEGFDRGNAHKAQVPVKTLRQGLYRATVTSVGQGEGPFTLTIRKEGGLNPGAPKRPVIKSSKSLFNLDGLLQSARGDWGFQVISQYSDSTRAFPLESIASQQPEQQADVYPYAGLPPKKSAEVMTVPDGFKVKLFAGEPDVHQPIAFCIDDRGRLWVAEAYCYPVRRADKDANDRILIFEDTDGDGVFDKKTVFMEGLNLVSGLEVGFGGVWIGAAPYLMFVPIKDGEDKPAGPAKILLDGWAYQDTHETLNSFTWGPDGWLYGCHGVFTHSRVGKPGTPDKERTPINAGVWRYHPTRHIFEVFAHGTSNPWGLDFDAHGQAFIEACVIPHNWHIIQGGRYFRQAGQHFNPYTFADIQTIAEHRHFIGADPWRANGRSDSVGGGHAHCGTMIYQGGAWPPEYDGLMFMGNVHGHRLNVDRLTPKGSGFVARPAPDFLLANDAWARFINMQYGPDGNVFVIDWYDQQACHDGKIQVWDRSNGRIYKVCHKDAKPVVGLDLAKLSDRELVDLQFHKNDWYVRHARRLLQERAARSELGKSAVGGLKSVHNRLGEMAFDSSAQETRRLRALWALHVIGGLAEPGVTKGLLDAGPYIRAWTIQLALENTQPSTTLLESLTRLAKNDLSPIVRLYLGSALQRLPLPQRWAALENLLAHSQDAGDHNLPLIYWYAAEPLAAQDATKALDLALASKVPPLPQFMALRISSAATPDAFTLLVDRLTITKDESLRLAILRGMQDALKGRRNLAMPPNWSKAYATVADSSNSDLRNAALTLAATFGDAKAIAALRDILASPRSMPAARQESLATLLVARDQQLVPVLHKLLEEPAFRGPALRGLAAYDDNATPSRILAVYPALSTQEKRDAVNTLAARAGYGKALLDAVDDKKIAANDVSADVVRQLRNLRDKALDQRIAEVWGIVRATPADRARQITEWRRFLSNPAKTDVSLGRAIFARTCQQCHTLFGEGGQVGPDITGGNRANLDYLLENIFDPSAVIPKEYTTTVLELKTGRVITGIIRNETAAVLTVQTVNETVTIPRDDIDTMKTSNISMMPDDLLGPLTKEEVRALIGYLQSPVQVPMAVAPAGKRPS
jgi:putative membrane-bound dehydrogenase-like protein